MSSAGTCKSEILVSIAFPNPVLSTNIQGTSVHCGCLLACYFRNPSFNTWVHRRVWHDAMQASISHAGRASVAIPYRLSRSPKVYCTHEPVRQARASPELGSEFEVLYPVHHNRPVVHCFETFTWTGRTSVSDRFPGEVLLGLNALISVRVSHSKIKP